MDVKPGYKQTEVGVIPEDWEVKSLGDIGESLIGLTYKPTDVRSDGVLVLRSSNVHEGTLRFDDNVFVEMDVPERIMVRSGDILICVRNGSRDLIGKCAQIDKRARGMTFGAFMAVFRSPFHTFVYHQFQSHLIKRQINEHLGATINQITNKSLNSFDIPLPPSKAEQEAIAEVLSDADALIESLVQLIIKKSHVKQGAMRELLTGKQRLPGFETKSGYKQTEVGVIPEDWDVGPLASVTPPNAKNGIVDGPFGSNLKTIHYRNSGIPIITSGYVTDGKFRADKYLYVDQAKFNAEKRSAVKPGDIVMAKIGERCGASAILPKAHETGILSGNALKITVDLQRHSTFYIWQVLWNLYSSGDIELLKTVGAQPAISMANLKKYKIALPPLAEQTAIAAILSDMDAEIAALEAKLGKARQLKQGMMQELLTGRTRLV